MLELFGQTKKENKIVPKYNLAPEILTQNKVNARKQSKEMITKIFNMHQRPSDSVRDEHSPVLKIDEASP